MRGKQQSECNAGRIPVIVEGDRLFAAKTPCFYEGDKLLPKATGCLSREHGAGSKESRQRPQWAHSGSAAGGIFASAQLDRWLIANG